MLAVKGFLNVNFKVRGEIKKAWPLIKNEKYKGDQK